MCAGFAGKPAPTAGLRRRERGRLFDLDVLVVVGHGRRLTEHDGGRAELLAGELDRPLDAVGRNAAASDAVVDVDVGEKPKL